MYLKNAIEFIESIRGNVDGDGKEYIGSLEFLHHIVWSGPSGYHLEDKTARILLDERGAYPRLCNAIGRVGGNITFLGPQGNFELGTGIGLKDASKIFTIVPVTSMPFLLADFEIVLQNIKSLASISGLDAVDYNSILAYNVKGIPSVTFEHKIFSLKVCALHSRKLFMLTSLLPLGQLATKYECIFN